MAKAAESSSASPLRAEGDGPERGALLLVAGADLVADPSGALWWPAEETLIVADLHFEKGSSFGRRGLFLPPYDTRKTLSRLEAVIAARLPRRVISLGDAFHDAGAEARMDRADAARLIALTHGREWVWIAGNHDPRPPARFEGAVAESYALKELVFEHAPSASGPVGQVAGHLHPVARARGVGRTLRRKCFITDGKRLVLPSFGAYTGGLNVRDPAFASVFRYGFSVCLIGRDAVYPTPTRALVAD